ncbi:MAG: LLM class flavin-dependent oxidoreductase, partial [Actinomycetota bacterium]|nr:LLM class flavin-dependent oxidoreductase [Actinomycetota bacterium]
MDFSLFYFADDGGSSTDRYRLLIEGARFADTHGFAAVWTPERHFHAFGGQYPYPAVTGAAVAAVTERVRLGSLVTPPLFRNAAVFAKQLATIDHIAGGGRVIAGLGAGWFEAEYLGYGAPFPPIGERLKA